MALEPDTFGLTVCSLVRDFYLLGRQKGARLNRIYRVVTTFMLLLMCISIQIYLLTEVKYFVSAKAVHDVRIAYDRFEHHMYNGHTVSLKNTPVSERRGLGGPHGPFFNRSAFYSLTDQEQSDACRIPLSQPLFFFTILYVWTLTCIAEIRQCLLLFRSLVLQTEVCASMAESLREGTEDGDARRTVWVVAKLTYSMKAVITGFVLLPRFCITLYLVWIGCRWLLGTNNFSDLILNAVALEFILHLKDVLYLALVPRRSMLDLEDTRIRPSLKQEPEGFAVFASTAAWAAVAVTWVVLYMGVPGHNGVQQVLRDYQWDVHDICTQWVTARYAV